MKDRDKGQYNNNRISLLRFKKKIVNRYFQYFVNTYIWEKKSSYLLFDKAIDDQLPRYEIFEDEDFSHQYHIYHNHMHDHPLNNIWMNSVIEQCCSLLK